MSSDQIRVGFLRVQSLIKSCNQSPRLVFKSLKSFNDQSSNQSRWQIFPPPAGAGSSTLKNENQISIRNNKNYQISCEVLTWFIYSRLLQKIKFVISASIFDICYSLGKTSLRDYRL